MSRFKIKKLPPIRLVDLLKKRRTNLKNFLSSYGVVSYSTLLQKCSNMGVSAPSEKEFKEVLGVAAEASSPQEGIVVLDPPTLLKELTGEKIGVDDVLDFQQQLPEVIVITDPNPEQNVVEQTLEETTETETETDTSTLQDTKFYKKKKEKTQLIKVDV